MTRTNLELLEKVRQRLCVYAGDPCDCKTIEGGITAGETSGCVEVRQAVFEIRELRENEARPDPDIVSDLRAKNRRLREKVMHWSAKATIYEIERDDLIAALASKAREVNVLRAANERLGIRGMEREAN